MYLGRCNSPRSPNNAREMPEKPTRPTNTRTNAQDKSPPKRSASATHRLLLLGPDIIRRWGPLASLKRLYQIAERRDNDKLGRADLRFLQPLGAGVPFPHVPRGYIYAAGSYSGRVRYQEGDAAELLMRHDAIARASAEKAARSGRPTPALISQRHLP